MGEENRNGGEAGGDSCRFKASFLENRGTRSALSGSSVENRGMNSENATQA